MNQTEDFGRDVVDLHLDKALQLAMSPPFLATVILILTMILTMALA